MISSGQPALAWPISDSELETYFLTLATSHLDEVFLGDVKINQIHVADGLYRSPSAPPSFLFQMIKNGKVIFLTRDNLLEAYLSGVIAAKSNIWHQNQSVSTERGAKFLDLPAFYVVPEQALWGVNVLEEDILLTRKWLHLWGDSILRVTYEQLFNGETGEIDQQQFHRIATFCGLPTHFPWQSELARSTSVSHLSNVANRDELERYFLQHGAERWLPSEPRLQCLRAA